MLGPGSARQHGERPEAQQAGAVPPEPGAEFRNWPAARNGARPSDSERTDTGPCHQTKQNAAPAKVAASRTMRRPGAARRAPRYRRPLPARVKRDPATGLDDGGTRSSQPASGSTVPRPRSPRAPHGLADRMRQRVGRPARRGCRMRRTHRAACDQLGSRSPAAHAHQARSQDQRRTDDRVRMAADHTCDPTGLHRPVGC